MRSTLLEQLALGEEEVAQLRLKMAENKTVADEERAVLQVGGLLRAWYGVEVIRLALPRPGLGCAESTCLRP